MVTRELHAIATGLIHRALAPGSHDTYSRVWANLKSFVTQTLQITWNLPLSEEVLLLYSANLYRLGSKASTMRGHLSAISYLHQLHRVHDPCKSFLVSNLTKGVAKSMGPARSKQPICINLLHRMLAAVPRIVTLQFDIVLTQAVFLMLYHACMRVGEAVFTSNKTDHALRFNQVKFHMDSSGDLHDLTVQFIHFKQSSGDLPPPLIIYRKPWYWCPVVHIHRYHAVRPVNGIHSGTYYFVKSDGHHVTSAFVGEKVAEVLTFLGEDASVYGSHGFRAGKCTDMVGEGRTTELVWAVGRWQSDAHHIYNRPKFIVS